MPVTRHGGLANRCTRPLCDLSVARAGGILPRPVVPTRQPDGRDLVRWPAAQEEGSMPDDDQRSVIEKAWIEPPPKLTGPITFVDYDPAWPGLYAREEA